MNHPIKCTNTVLVALLALCLLLTAPCARSLAEDHERGREASSGDPDPVGRLSAVQRRFLKEQFPA